MKRVHLIICGDAQGVGFRMWALRYAQSNHLVGWVKNRDDGTVELVAEGLRSQLEELIKQCQHGPDVAWVTRVDSVWSDGTGEFATFHVR